MASAPDQPTGESPARTRLWLADLQAMKRRGEKIAMVTAYDAPSARLAEEAGMDVLLVGDSAAMTVLGHDSTTPVTIDEMLMLTRAVARVARRAIVIADLPFGSFQVSDEQTVEHSVRFMKEAGAHGVKLEGAGRMLSRVRALVGIGHRRHGPHRPDAPVGDDARRLRRARAHGLRRAASGGRRPRARGRRVFFPGARGDSRAGRPARDRGRVHSHDWHRRRHRLRRSGARLARPHRPHARVISRGSSSATPTWPPPHEPPSRRLWPTYAPRGSRNPSTATACPTQNSSDSRRRSPPERSSRGNQSFLIRVREGCSV